MAYTKHEFKSGEKLYATQLNEMEDQIAKNEEELVKVSEEIDDLKENGGGGGGSGSGGCLVVNSVYDEATDTVSVDKTYDEIVEAAKTQTVVLNADGDISYLTQAYDGEAVFVQPFFTYNQSNDSYTNFDSWVVTRIKADGTVKTDQF